VDANQREPVSITNTDGILAGMPLANVERQAILETLKQTKGNQTRAAKVLGISDRTLRDKMKRYRQEKCPQPV
jgi:DNA-binding protein Fis